MRKSFLLCLTLLCAIAGACRAENLVLTAAKDEDTGLKAIMEAWSDEELKRQGGKFADHGWWPWGLTAFDYDNDGDLDLLPAHHGQPGGRLLKNMLKESGKLTFVDVNKDVAGCRLSGADDRPWTWDFDGDGWLDIAGFSDESKAKSFINQEGKKFVEAPFSFNPLAHAYEVADLNGDGIPDMWGNHRDSRLMFIYDPSAKTFQTKTEKKIQAVPQDRIPAALLEELAKLKEQKNNRFLSWSFNPAGDLNGDGRDDVYVSIAGGYGATAAGRYLIAAEDGKLSDQTEALGLPKTGTPILVRDLTGDGRCDIIVGASTEAGLYINDGKGKFAVQAGALKAFLEKTGPYPLRAWPNDLDNDGDLDLVVSNPRGGAEEVHENVGGKFERVLAAGGWDSNPVVVCDIDNNGTLDVCIGGPKNTITLYLCSAVKPGGAARIVARMDKPNPFAVGALVEIFKAGDAADAKPLWSEKARHDGKPVHAGLGELKTYDVRVTFPGKEPKRVEYKGLDATKAYRVTPDGKYEEIK